MKDYLYRDLYEEEERHWWHQAKRKIVLDFIKIYIPNKKLTLIDIGCGTGKNMETLQQFGQAWGLDSSTKAIKYCKKRGLSNVILGNAEDTKLAGNKFDLVTLLDVLEHVDDDKLLKEMSRILKKNGYLLITVPALEWMWSQWDVVLHHKRRYTKKSLISILQKNKFEIITISYMYLFLILPALVVRMMKKIHNKKEYGSDFSLSNPFLNKILSTFAAIERYFIKRGLIPVGLSLIVLAQKKP